MECLQYTAFSQRIPKQNMIFLKTNCEHRFPKTIPEEPADENFCPGSLYREIDGKPSTDYNEQ